MLLEVHTNNVPLSNEMRQEIHRRRRGLLRFQGYLSHAVLTMQQEGKGAMARYRCHFDLRAVCGQPILIESMDRSVERSVRQAFRHAVRATRNGFESLIAVGVNMPVRGAAMGSVPPVSASPPPLSA